jgi:hypothetical protein
MDLEPGSLPDWIAAGAGALTALVALPAAAILLRDRMAAHRERLQVTSERHSPTSHRVTVRFQPPDSSFALDCTATLKQPVSAVIGTEGGTRYDTLNGDVIFSEPVGLGCSAVGRMRSHRDHADRGVPGIYVETFYVFSKSELSAITLGVTICTWPSGKRLIRTTRTTSPIG